MIRSVLKPKTINSTQSNTQTQNVVVNNIFPGDAKTISDSLKDQASSNEVNHLKQETQILFIDDLDLKRKIKNLQDAGWQRVSQIKDVPNIDAQQIRDASIIFVDYKGIGEIKTSEQGLSILSALRNRYGDTKHLILYSAHPVPLDAFKRGAGDYLSKNTTIYELEQKILEGVTKIIK